MLVRGQERPQLLPGQACPSRIHGHCSREKADGLAADGRAEWLTVEKVSAKGRVTRSRLPAIVLAAGRKWRAKVSGVDGRPMKVMQLVP